jgi:hypothetical protein
MLCGILLFVVRHIVGSLLWGEITEDAGKYVGEYFEFLLPLLVGCVQGLRRSS